MGKKYIIEMEDMMFHKTGESGAETFLWRVNGFNSLVFDRAGIDKLTPYTEPDLEQVRKEAYDKGWKEAENYYDEYHVGDEFENGDGQKFVVLKMDGKEIDRYIDGDGKTYVMATKYRVMRKTGRHFPEIAAVLEKMRGEQE